MKIVGIVYIVLFVFSCKDESIEHIDNCPKCSSSVELNGIEWPSKPNYAIFSIREPIDTAFALEINESHPAHDPFQDALFFWQIPFEAGEYKLDADLQSIWGTSVTLYVFEVEYGTATQFYWPIYDGSSFINVESLNKTTGEFSLNFNLLLFPAFDTSKLNNSTYPKSVQFIGQAQGVVTPE